METNSQDFPIAIDSLSKHPIKKVNVQELDYYFIEKGEGETIFFLHGFPDMANTWDETIDVLSENYHCVAPFLRGYYPTAMATDRNYSPKSIAEDIHQIAQQLGIQQYYVVGQDWGAFITYSLANLHPEAVKKIVTVAIPHSSCLRFTPLAVYKARHFIKFSNPKKALAFTAKNNFQYLDVLYKRWSPNWKNFKETSDLIKKTFALEGRLAASLGYYWSFGKTRKDKEQVQFFNQLPTMPLLTFAGKTDGALLFKPFERMKKVLKNDFELVYHETAGHFLHQEVPEFFIEKVKEFLNK